MSEFSLTLALIITSEVMEKRILPTSAFCTFDSGNCFLLKRTYEFCMAKPALVSPQRMCLWVSLR